MIPGSEGSLLDRLTRLAVSLNGVVIPGGSIESVLARHALTFVINNEGDETFKVSPPGFAMASCCRDRDLMLITPAALAIGARRSPTAAASSAASIPDQSE